MSSCEIAGLNPRLQIAGVISIHGTAGNRYTNPLMIVLSWDICQFGGSVSNAFATHGRKSEAPYTRKYNSEWPVAYECNGRSVSLLGVVIAMLLMHQRMIFQSHSASVICRS